MAGFETGPAVRTRKRHNFAVSSRGRGTEDGGGAGGPGRRRQAAEALARAAGSGYLNRAGQTCRAKRGSQGASSQRLGSDAGDQAERIQEALTKAEYDRNPAGDEYSASVTLAVRAFQKAEKAGPVGIAGPSRMKDLGLCRAARRPGAPIARSGGRWPGAGRSWTGTT